MGGFLGGIIKRMIMRAMMMRLLVGGGQAYLSHNGGIAGVLNGGPTGPGGTAMGQPISAGLGGLAGALGIGAVPAATHYEAQGRINAIREECRLVRRSGGREQRTEPLACDRARMALSYPQFEGYTLREARVASYIYYDMDGINVLTGKVDATRGHRVGDVIDLSIDRADPRRSTPL